MDRVTIGVRAVATGAAGTGVDVPTVYASGPVAISEWEAAASREDGRRYELVDGTVYVSDPPSPLHQAVVGRLGATLRRAAPSGVEVVPGPVDFEAGRSTIVAPDLVVVPLAETSGTRLHVPPLLVVEVMSPSSRRYDRVQKLATYDAGGVDDYWVVDPNPRDPSLLVFGRRGGALVQVATVHGSDPFVATAPYEVTVVPAALVDGLR